tara:strand:+ start:340 stop:780 length:441 start_codon:yes stop_codon:yes gene_type:complete
MKTILSIILLVLIISNGCENQSLSEDEKFATREIHENVQWHFDKIEVDGAEYLILEKDNNNPHEGFGFMSIRANTLLQKQDSILAYSILAYLKANQQMQTKIYAELNSISEEDASIINNRLYNQALMRQSQKLQDLSEQNHASKLR